MAVEVTRRRNPWLAAWMGRGDGSCGGGLSHASHDSHGSSVSMQRRKVNAHDGSCFCGLKTVIKKSGTAENPNRLFHACPRYRVSDGKRS